MARRGGAGFGWNRWYVGTRGAYARVVVVAVTTTDDDDDNGGATAAVMTFLYFGGVCVCVCVRRFWVDGGRIPGRGRVPLFGGDGASDNDNMR